MYRLTALKSFDSKSEYLQTIKFLNYFQCTFLFFRSQSLRTEIEMHLQNYFPHQGKFSFFLYNYIQIQQHQATSILWLINIIIIMLIVFKGFYIGRKVFRGYWQLLNGWSYVLVHEQKFI